VRYELADSTTIERRLDCVARVTAAGWFDGHVRPLPSIADSPSEPFVWIRLRTVVHYPFC
jgi:hypothetical protein